MFAGADPFRLLITIFPIELDVDRLGQAVSPFFETPYMYVYTHRVR